MFNESYCLNSGRVLAEVWTGRCWTPCSSVIGSGLLFWWEVSANLLTIQSWNLKATLNSFFPPFHQFLHSNECPDLCGGNCLLPCLCPSHLSLATHRCLVAYPFHCILRSSSSQQPCTGSELQGLSLPEEKAWTPENNIQNLPPTNSNLSSLLPFTQIQEILIEHLYWVLGKGEVIHMWLMLQRGKMYPQTETVQDRTDLLRQRHKVPWECREEGLIRDL